MDAGPCAECGFEAGRWTVRDAASLFAELGFWWRLALEGRSLTASVAPAEIRHAVTRSCGALATAGERLGVERLGVDSMRDDVGAAGAALASACRRRQAPSAVVLEAVLPAVHDVSHAMADASAAMTSSGLGGPPQHGSVARLNVSQGGLPKHAVDGAAVTFQGVEGDHQAERLHHGRPFQALCVWSSEVIADLAAHGHPVFAGAAGENVTLSRLQWATILPGSRLTIGDAVAEVSFPATPCFKQRPWFSNGDFSLIDHANNPAWTRWYAWVRRPGRIHTGDTVVLNP